MSRTTHIHLFSLPPELLETLTPRTLFAQSQEPIESKSEPEKAHLDAPPLVAGARSCNVCLGALFADVDDQRLHFRSDWHRYNVKVRLANGKAVSETEFASLVEGVAYICFSGLLTNALIGLEDSLSGSASSSDDDDEASDSDAVNNLLSKTRIQARSPSPTSIAYLPQTALAWFHSPPSTQLGVYRTIFPTSTQRDAYLSELRSMQNPVPGGRKWTMFMVAGGHFAGVVVRVSKPSDIEEIPVAKGKQKKPIPDMEILRHKTFHRYTSM